MWLPETAADTPSLEALASAGIRFAILAPHQCAAVRPPEGAWIETPGGAGLDPTRPYRVVLPSGATLTLFFYFGGISHDIAFAGLLDNGDRFAERLMSAVPSDEGENRLLLVATDGETYGHHHRFGEMALARAIERIFNDRSIRMMNLETFLKETPVRWECRIAERTSWSCAHGVERWRSDCGCRTGGEPGWNQAWRGPLREALDRLRDRIDERYEALLAPCCENPWRLRDAAIALALHPDRGSAEEDRARKRRFLSEHCGPLGEEETVRALTLLEAQRQRMFMYTSCGWFFNDVAGIETVQILAYAVRAAELTERVSGASLLEDFLKDLERARGNRPDLPTARAVVEARVLPRRRSLRDVAAAAALLDTQGGYYTHQVENRSRLFPSGDLSLRVAHIRITDGRTGETERASAAVLSSGGLDDVCRLRSGPPPDEAALRRAFYEKDLLSLSRTLEAEFPLGPWRLDTLSPDDRRLVADERNREAEAEQLERAEEILKDGRRLLVQLHAIGAEAPPFLRAAAGLVMRERFADLASRSPSAAALLAPESDLEALLEEAHSMGLEPELSLLAPRLAEEMHELLHRVRAFRDPAPLAECLHLWKRAKELDIRVDPWRLQNEIHRILENPLTDPDDTLLELAESLGFATPRPRRGG